MNPVFWFGCYGCVFHETGNSGQLCQNFRVSSLIVPFFSIYINWTDNQKLPFMGTLLEVLYNYEILFILMIMSTAMIKILHCNVKFWSTDYGFLMFILLYLNFDIWMYILDTRDWNLDSPHQPCGEWWIFICCGTCEPSKRWISIPYIYIPVCNRAH
jgi:hypothetical protein